MSTTSSAPGAPRRARTRFFRVPAKWFIRKLASYLTETDIKDLNSGLRAFRRDVAMQYVHQLPTGFSCVTTLTMSFLSNGYSVKYVPIDYFPRAGTSKFHWWRDTKRYLLQVVRMTLSYNPLKVFLPIGAGRCSRVGLGKLVYDWVDKDFRLAANTLLILFAVAAGDHRRPARRPHRAGDQTADPGAAGVSSHGRTPTGNTYDKYGTTNPIEQRMMRGFMGALDEMLDGPAPRRILEIGVGEGHVMTRVRERFPGVPLVGLDLPDESLGDEWRQAGLPCMFGDATTLPFPDDSFDLVLAIEVLEHVPGPRRRARPSCPGCAPARSSPRCRSSRSGAPATSPARRYVRQLGNTPGHVNHWTRWGFQPLRRHPLPRPARPPARSRGRWSAPPSAGSPGPSPPGRSRTRRRLRRRTVRRPSPARHRSGCRQWGC